MVATCILICGPPMALLAWAAIHALNRADAAAELAVANAAKAEACTVSLRRLGRKLGLLAKRFDHLAVESVRADMDVDNIHGDLREVLGVVNTMAEDLDSLLERFGMIPTDVPEAFSISPKFTLPEAKQRGKASNN